MPIPHLNEFRRQYPAASLRTDLLAIHDKTYVVRSQVWVEGALLASAMAADVELETAEDRACLRVLQCLTESETALSAAPEPATTISPSPAPAAAAPPAASTGNGVAAQRKTATAQPVPTPVPAKKQPSLPEDTDFPPLTEPEPIQNWAQGPMLESPVSAEAVSPTPLQTSPAEPPAAAVSPVDLSDIIAQTDVELRRLGWTVGQGREFLEKTYGKRSRHDLTDQELLEFLLYLETQPSPVES